MPIIKRLCLGWNKYGTGLHSTINSATSAANAVIAPGQGFMVGGNYSNSGTFTTFNSKIDLVLDDGIFMLVTLWMMIGVSFL